MPDDRLLFAVLVRLAIVGAAVLNAVLAFGQYREFRDARGLRGFVSALTMLFAASAIASSSATIRHAYPALEGVFDWTTTVAVAGVVLGIMFSVYSWRMDRREARRRRRALLPYQAHYDGRGDH